MHELAKMGILITNIAMAFGAVLFIVFMTGLLGATGAIFGTLGCIASGTLWFMLVSAYTKFMATK